MNQPKGYGAVKQYQKLATTTDISQASPHRLVQMLMEGALDKIAATKGFVQRQDIEAKNAHATWAVSIITGLRMSLDKDQGGEIARNLDDLYDYINRRIMEGSNQSDVGMLDEVTSLLLEVKSGWDAIGDQVSAADHAEPKTHTSVAESV